MMSMANVADGEWVEPQQVVGPDQPGRKVVILGETSNPKPALQWAQGAHTIVAALPVSPCPALSHALLL